MRDKTTSQNITLQGYTFKSPAKIKSTHLQNINGIIWIVVYDFLFSNLAELLPV